MRADADFALPIDGTARANKRRPFRILLLLIGLGVALAGVLAVLDARRVAGELRNGRAAFHALTDGGLAARGELHAQARVGAAYLAAAERRARESLWLRLWSRIPLVGRPARWLRGATDVAADLSRRASDAVGRIEPKLDAHGADARLSFLALAEREFADLLHSLDGVRLPSSGGFLPPVEAARHELTRELRSIHVALTQGVASVRGIRSLLNGPSTYLVLAANNAEMRAGGMVLQAGVLLSAAGRVDATDFRSTADLILNQPVPLPPQIQQLYGWLSPGIEWRNVGSSPNFPATAPIYASMAERVGGRRVDGVLQIDVLGVRALLETVGPVEVLGRRYDAANVERLVMHDLYRDFGGQQVERRREFSQLAAATFQALNDRPLRFERLARALREAAAGRHVFAWSRRPVEQEAWRRLRLDGAVPRDGLMLTVQNHTGNKLDWFVQPTMDLHVEGLPGTPRRIHLRIRIENPTPSGESPYVAGDGSLVPPGDHRALVAVYLPGWATDVEMPKNAVAIVGPDGASRVIGTRVDIARGTTVEIEVVFSAPPDADRIVLIPSARARPVPLTLGKMVIDDARERIVSLSSLPVN